MVHVVLPKLVIAQEDDDKAVVTLFELAKWLNTYMVQLIVNWLPKVLAYALYQADRHKLDCALQFYRDQTGSDKKEIFVAALPTLLDELICSVDVDDSVDNSISYRESVCRLTSGPI
ncbi:putative non-specific serine/threonine protein kinase [Helianthus debilis subsp. tardiflorus]